MPIHLQDWLGDHPWLIWVLVIPLLLAGESLHPRRTALCCVPAALTGALVALIGPGLWWLQLLLAGMVLALALVVFRPRVRAWWPPRAVAHHGADLPVLGAAESDHPGDEHLNA